MIPIIAYIAPLILFFIIVYASGKKEFLGLNRNMYGITFYWILIYVLYVYYMLGYGEYNPVLDLSCIALFVFAGGVSNVGRILKSYIYWYVLFFLWCIICSIRSVDYYQALKMMTKLSMPMIVGWFSYNAFISKASIWAFFKKMSYLPIYYLIVSLIGVPLKEYLPVYPYFGMAVMVFPVIMFLKTREKKFLLLIVLCLSANVIEIKRTPLLGMLLMISVLFYFKYRLRALIPILMSAILFIAAVLYIPALRERVFFEGFEVNDVTMELVLNRDANDIINTNGRHDMWQTVKDKFYKNNEVFGSGLGTMKSFLLSRDNDTGHFLRLHNDWLHLLCETGWVGVGLLLMMFLSLFRKTFQVYRRGNSDSGLIALACAMAAIATMTHMYFENCIGVFGYYIPFVFSAIFFRYIELDRKEFILKKAR